MKKITFVLIFFFAHVAYAQVVISEIMYDPQGGDTGHEWIEIVNEGSASVDLVQSKFFEEGSNHGLSVTQGSTKLSAGAYAIIADDAQKFLTDHSGFSGTVIDSSFSLKNTGETVSFKTPDGNISDTATYTSDMGGSSDGNSLQKVSGVWKSATPTPGAENIFEQNINTSSQNSSAPPSAGPTGVNTSPAVSSSAILQIAAETGPQVRVVLAGAPVVFEGNVSGLESSPGATRTTWSFGDGASGEGTSVSHTYYYPGEYTAIIDVSSGALSATDRMLVRVVSPNISVQTGGDATRSYVAIENQGSDELDLSGWQITSAEKKFIFPKNTILAAHKGATFASEVTGLTTPAGESVELMFPNGAIVTTKIKRAAPVIATSKVAEKSSPKPILQTSVAASPAPAIVHQEAAVLGAFDEAGAPPGGGSGTLWPWYIGAAFFAALALLGLRLTREKNPGLSSFPTADDFEIISDVEREK